MKILRVAVGDSTEAYIENELKDGVNIIFSDDNNKGKTIVVQGMMYALGNEPAFPVSFDYHRYSFYVEFEENGKKYFICRKGDSFVLKSEEALMLFDNVSELKRYWTKHIFPLPVITKNEMNKIVDPVLFVQLFFVGQDKKDTSNIANSGLYNKQDFWDMVYSHAGIGDARLSEEEIGKLKAQLVSLKEEKNTLLKQHKILKSKKTPVSYLSTTSDRLAFQSKLDELEKIKSKIEALRKARNVAMTRKMKWETTLKELRSLNRTINCGELRCMDCNSTNISLSTSHGKQQSYTFDISTVELRNEIIGSISEKIASFAEEIERLSTELSIEQDKLQEAMADDSVSLESLVMYKKDVFDASDAEKKIQEIDSQIAEAQTKQAISENASDMSRQKRNELFASIIGYMNELYRVIDPAGNTEYQDIFTKRNALYSGSESTVFHIARVLAFQHVLGHNYPIVIDSYRAEDLSTSKEAIIIEKFKEIQNQIIVTTTLKDEEGGKYNNISGINAIDYGTHSPSKILVPNAVDKMRRLLSALSLEL